MRNGFSLIFSFLSFLIPIVIIGAAALVKRRLVLAVAGFQTPLVRWSRLTCSLSLIVSSHVREIVLDPVDSLDEGCLEEPLDEGVRHCPSSEQYNVKQASDISKELQ